MNNSLAKAKNEETTRWRTITGPPRPNGKTLLLRCFSA